jgi:hypothetical protein
MPQYLQAYSDRRAAWCEIWRLWRALCRMSPAALLAGPQADECAWRVCWMLRQCRWPWRWLCRRLLSAMYRHADPRSRCPSPDRLLSGAVYQLRLTPPGGGNGWRLRVR